MPKIPRASGFDSTLAFAREGNTFISNRCKRYETEIFQTRLMLKKVVCLMGEEAATLFYDTNLFKRQGAAPKRVQKTLFGQGGVQGLDGTAHRLRKQAFMSLMGPGQVQSLTNEVADVWRAYISKWAEKADEPTQLFYEANEILCRAACTWAGIALKEYEVKEKTENFMAIIDSAATIGPKHWRGRRARKQMNTWLEHIIEEIRAGQRVVPTDSAATVFAFYRDPEGCLLDPKTAAVELNNIIRPTVAIARFITFAALALHEHPQWRVKLQTNGDEYITLFVQEVRRFYPFFPAVAAITRKDFNWRGYHFSQGQWVMLDLYGTSHDDRSWQSPDKFHPERFREWNGSPFNFIPQGGGDHHQNHRCAGEWATIEVMKVALRMLTRSMHYDVPPQNLDVDRTKMPALPKSGFIIKHVQVQQKAADRGQGTQAHETAQDQAAPIARAPIT